MGSPNFRLHFIVFLWGWTGIVGKLISISALPLVYTRMMIASGLLFLFVLSKKQLFSLTKKQFFMLFGTGILIAVHWYLFFSAIKVSNVSIALSTLASCSFFSIILDNLINKTRIKSYEVIISVITIICLGIIFKIEFHYKEGIILGILASFLAALFQIINAKMVNKVKSNVIMFYEILSGWIFLNFIFFFLGDSLGFLFHLTPKDTIYLLILGGLLTVFPMIESVSLMKHISPYTLLLTVNLEPIYGIFLAYLIFGQSEQMSFWFYFSTLIIIFAIISNSWIKNRFKKKYTKDLIEKQN